ncbi:MAG TPA: hypothetical protein VNO22_14950 [Planctomycetota bacterium]|nr:hypothetical protein [Planctomycetota bacterium]
MSGRIVPAVLAAALAACRPSVSQEASMTPAAGSAPAPAPAAAGTLRTATFALG